MSGIYHASKVFFMLTGIRIFTQVHRSRISSEHRAESANLVIFPAILAANAAGPLASQSGSNLGFGQILSSSNCHSTIFSKKKKKNCQSTMLAGSNRPR